MKIYNGENMILGRLATIVAKEILLGEEVRVVNCEKVVISVYKFKTFALQLERRERKTYPLKSAKLHRVSDRYVRRTIRGMLPWKTMRGKEAFKRVMCYKGIPAEFREKELIVNDKASVSKLPMLKYVTVGEVCRHIGGKQ